MKNYFFLSIIFFCAIISNAQSTEELITQYAEFLKQGDCVKAIEKGNALIKIYKQNHNDSSFDYATIISLQGACYVKVAKADSAELLYIRCLSILKKLEKTQQEIYLTVLNSLAMLYEDNNNFSKAEPYLTELTEMVKIKSGEISEDHAFLLERLVFLLTKTNQYEKAETAWQNLIKVSKEINGEFSKEYAGKLAQFALFYHNAEKLDKAEPLYLQSIQILKQWQEDSENNYPTIISNLATLYESKGEYKKAELLIIEALELRKKSPGVDDPSYASSVNKLAGLYESMGEYKKAEPLYFEAISLRKKILGEDHPLYANSVNDLAALYESMGEYKKAEQYYVDSKNIRKKVLGEQHPDYAASLNNLASLYQKQGLYTQAEPLLTESSNIMKKAVGENHTDYALSLNNLARLYDELGRFEKAEALYKQSKDIYFKNFGEVHPDYALVLNNLANLYDNMGLYKEAEQLYIRAKDIRKKILGEKSLDYAGSLNNLAGLYVELGQYKMAETMMLESKEIQKKFKGEFHPDYAMVLNNLAVLYIETGQFEKSERLYIEARDIWKNSFGENHPDYATSLNNLAELYRKMGQLEKAESFYIAAKDIRKKVFGENHPDYAISLNNLADFYKGKEDYTKAEPLFVEAKNIWKKTLGENHPVYATSLNNLASLYKSMGDFKRSDSLFTLSKDIRKKILGTDHPDYAASLNNLADLYMKNGDYRKAETFYLESKETWKKAFGEDHPVYAISLHNLANLYELSGDYNKAWPIRTAGDNIILNTLKNTFSSLSEKEKEKYISSNISMIESNNSLLFTHRNATAEISVSNFDQQLLFKSFLLNDTRNILESVKNKKDSNLLQLLDAWQANKTFLSKQYSLPVKNRMQKLDSIVAKTEFLEKDLNLKSTEFRNQQKATNLTANDVRAKLVNDEVAIEFVRFRLFNKKWTDSILYAAYILNKNDSFPQFVPLCEEKQLGKYFSSTGGAATIKTLYRSEVVDENEKPAISGDSLFALIWKPLLPYLKGVKKINYSPAGLLYKIAFHALPAGDSLLLMDKYELNQYTSTRQLAITEEKKNKNTSITLFGDCQFTMDSTAIVNKIPVNEKVNTLITASISRGENAGGWKQLSGTADEIRNIQVLFDKNKINTNAFTQATATEEQFKSLSGNSPSIIHLATHGFFLPDPEKKKQEGFAADERNAFTLADDPLLRSGIVLSGANRVWSGKPPIEGREDGIVTAYEIAQMDLSKTDLVVLSACETALGDIKGNEGVFGLQRAFKLAGVKNMLLSLWKVPDAETAELMKDFYTYYLQGKTASESFAAAQKDMRKKYKPYYWAAFVLIE
jgi:CHAT domain-containing protein/tetratricopeptide (TPR) repeat protein